MYTKVETDLSVDDMYSILLDFNVATQKELNLITSINGFNEESFYDILYVRTGLRRFIDLFEEV
jgi:hypothetical protein